MKKILLNIVGLSNSQSQMGAYALILGEEEGNRRLPIIIGAYEAQSIALQIEGLVPPRPLTHDLFLNFAQAFEIRVEEVFIHKLEEGIFYSYLECKQEDRVLRIDARTSDAVSLALRFGCPIYTTPDIMDKAGFDPDLSSENPEPKKPRSRKKSKGEFEDLSIDELEFLLSESISNEDYERASVIRDEILRRKGESKDQA